MEDPLKALSPARLALFRLYLHFLFRRRFDQVLIRSALPNIPAGRPLAIFCNHPSWWDPVLFMLLAPRLFPGRRCFGPMDAEALDRYPLFRRLGVFGIELHSPRGAALFLKTCLNAFADPATLLYVTAEGGFADPRRRPIRLQPGIAHLARRVPGLILLPMAMEYSFWSESRPVSLMAFGTPIDADPQFSIPEWTSRLENALTETMDDLAADSISREFQRFVPALRGAEGGDGLYDFIRATTARLQGRPFRARHAPQQGKG